jgi:hypothetical protein
VDIVHINRFTDQYDNRVKPMEVQWPDFCAFLVGAWDRLCAGSAFIMSESEFMLLPR